MPDRITPSCGKGCDCRSRLCGRARDFPLRPVRNALIGANEDRKSTRLNSSHVKISYAVFCLKKKHMRMTIHLMLLTSHCVSLLRLRFSNVFGSLHLKRQVLVLL